LFFSTGYMTNLGVVAGLAGPGDLIVSDELNHASLIDACRLSRAEVKVYPHCDWRAAQSLLAGGRKTSLKLLVSDGVFSMDGDLAPVPELLGVAQEQGALLVMDDAHATGVWGATGRGTVEHYGLPPCSDLVMIGTFSKALGGLGGFAAGDQLVIDSLIHRARSLLYTTAPPPAQAAVAAEGLRLVDEEAWRRDKLHELCARLRRNLADIGMTVLSEQGPIVPVLTGTAQAAVDLSEGMLERGIYAPAMRPPTVPEGKSRVRITVSAAHEEEDMDLAAEILAQSAGKAGAA
jgi:glycine C-acetyltransferase/8-amino-7-oxononanoate synthase